MQDVRNETLGIFGSTLQRVMDGTKKKLTIFFAKRDGEAAKATYNFKQRKAVQRTRAPTARPAPAARTTAARAPGAASKAELRKQAREEAAMLASASEQLPKAPRRTAATSAAVLDASQAKPKKPKKRSTEYPALHLLHTPSSLHALFFMCPHFYCVTSLSAVPFQIRACL